MDTYLTKRCFKCNQIKPIYDFYKHPHMNDGHLNKCKECTKIDSYKTRLNKIEYYRKWDKKRGNRQTNEYRKKYKELYPEKYQAWSKISNSVRDGKIEKKPCEICGKKEVHAHHLDYSQPLAVRWLCPIHHSQFHFKNGNNNES